MAGRIVCLLARDGNGDFLDPLSGARLRCVADGAGIQPLVEKFNELRLSGMINRGKTELRLSEVRLLATNTAGGEFKAGRRFNL